MFFKRLALLAILTNSLHTLSAQQAFDPKNIDTTVKPCEDFFHYANGAWIKNNPIPGEYSTWGSFVELAERNNLILKDILEDAAKKSGEKAVDISLTPIQKKIGDFYASGMDVEQINKLGLTPLKPELDRIAALKSTKDLPAAIAHLHSIGVNVCFTLVSSQDSKDSTSVIADLDQSGLGLPDRDYYTKTDEATKKTREDYLEHLEKMFGLTGETPEAAKADAEIVLKFETKLAEASMTKVARRDPEAVYHKMTLAEVKKLAPDFDFDIYMTGQGLSKPGDINVDVPDFVKKINEMLGTESLTAWQTYLRWHLISDYAGDLSDPFVNENFRFYGTILTGAKELKPRWKRVLGSTNGAMGEALGQVFVAKNFTPEARKRVLDLVAELRSTLRERLQKLTWMGAETKKAAVIKLDKFNVKMGYPDKWRDYSSLEISRDNFVQNVMNGAQFENKRDLAKIGKPLDRGEWHMTPQTVNAYYDPGMNEIVFPAAILQPPFFSPTADDAINYGGIGAVIGHEMTHGFDDQGRKFDAEGNLKDWWTAEDAKNFDARAGKVVDQYGNYSPLEGLKVNGQLTQGENIADIGGVRIAWESLQRVWAKARPGSVDGFTPAQRFFLGFAQIWRSNIRNEALRMRIQTDPHSPAMYRVNGVVANMPEFFDAFDCGEKSPLEQPADKRAEIW